MDEPMNMEGAFSGFVNGSGDTPLDTQTLAGAEPAAKPLRTKRTRRKRRSGAKSRAGVAQQAKYPRHAVERALRIPRAIYEQNAGNPCTPREAAIFTGAGGVSGPFTVEVSSAKKYGFLESEAGKLVLQDRARKAIAPQSETDRVSALREAVLAAPDLSAVYNFYRGENLPDDQFFQTREMRSLRTLRISRFAVDRGVSGSIRTMRSSG